MSIICQVRWWAHASQMILHLILPAKSWSPFWEKKTKVKKKKKRKPRCRERNEIVHGQPIQEAGASREPLSIPLAPGPPCLAPWHLGIVWLLSQLHRDAKSGGRCPSKGVCLVSLGGWAEFIAFNPHRCPVWPLPCCPGKHVEGDRGLVFAQPFFFFFLFHSLRLLAFIVYDWNHIKSMIHKFD